MKPPTQQQLAQRLAFSSQLIITCAHAIQDNADFLPDGDSKRELLATACQLQEISQVHQHQAELIGKKTPIGSQRQLEEAKKERKRRFLSA